MKGAGISMKEYSNMERDFIIGCNYWASHAGTEMWKVWDESVIRQDLKILSDYGIQYLRVFPNWRDFQPIMPVYSGNGALAEYILEGDQRAENPYWLDEIMLYRFEKFCDICEEYHMHIIVGLLTGWMSGRLFVPSALFGRNLFTDTTALYFEQRFIQGFVSRLKKKTAIYAWDLGNECNCMGECPDKFAALNWTATISNAIRANDNTRLIVSGMHTLGADDAGVVWTIEGQSQYSDVLTTHPYPLWVKYAYHDRTASFRTTIHAACETRYYADLGAKPCLVEEIGTMGPMICDNEKAADFMRVNLFSNWANGAAGVMWWCANEQTNLKTIPYSTSMVERELGMIDAERMPKPVLRETKKFVAFLQDLDFRMPKAAEDGVCVITKGQDHWGVAYMTYALAKQAGMNLRFCYCNDKLPESSVYMIPSAKGTEVMPLCNYQEIRQRVYDGATLYISLDDGIFSEFESLSGMRVSDSGRYQDERYMDLHGRKIAFARDIRYELMPVTAKVIAYDNEGLPAVTMNAYGKGRVYIVNFPLESMMIRENDAFDTERYLIYREIFKEHIGKHIVKTSNPRLALTIHSTEGDTAYAVVVNHSDCVQNMGLQFADGYVVQKLIYGQAACVEAFDAVVLKLYKRTEPVY